MINFCLTVILLSAFRKIMYQIDSNAVTAFDNTLENIFLAVAGVVIFLKDIIKPTRTEVVLYKGYKELAIESFRLNSDILKSTAKAISEYFTNSKAVTDLKLLPVTENDTSDYETQSHAA